MFEPQTKKTILKSMKHVDQKRESMKHGKGMLATYSVSGSLNQN